MSNRRMFECVEGSSSKFWEVWAEGETVFTRFGKIGSTGQTKVKREEAPDAAIDKLIREKTGKGYVEKTGGAKAKSKGSKKALIAMDEDEDEADDEDDDEDGEGDGEDGDEEDEADDLVEGVVRRFEQSTKFWEIQLDGASHTVRFGKLGSAGQEKTKDFRDVDDARADYRKLVAEKTGKGYAEVDAAASSAPELDAKELKRHLAALPPLVDDPGYLVFADWLQTKDHPWGTLIALQHAIATNAKKSGLQKDVDKLLATEGAAILGALARSRGSRWTWHLGFLRRAEISCRAGSLAIADAAKAVFALPAAHMLETIVFAPVVEKFDTWRSWESSFDKVLDPWFELDKLKKLVPTRIARMGFGAWPAAAASAYVEMPKFGALSKAFPHLTHLEMTGFCFDKPGKLSLPKLVDLSVRFCRATAIGLEAIATSKLPKLERLAVWLGGTSNVCVDDVYAAADWEEDQEWADRYPATFSASDLEKMSPHDIEASVDPAALEPLLAASFGPSFTQLAIGGPCVDAEIVRAIVRSPLTKRLSVLDLSNCEAAEDVLLAAKKSLAHLTKLVVASASKKLTAALPNTTVVKSGDDDFHFRFVATVE